MKKYTYTVQEFFSENTGKVRWYVMMEPFGGGRRWPLQGPSGRTRSWGSAKTAARDAKKLCEESP